MAEGAPTKEQIILEVVSPRMPDKDSGLNQALRQLGAIDRLMTIIGNKMTAMQGMKFGGASGSGFSRGVDPLRAISAQFKESDKILNDMIQSNRTTAQDAKAKIGPQKINLEVPGYDIHAFLAPGTKVKLQIGADQVVGGVPPGGGKGGSGSGGSGGGGTPEGPVGPKGSFPSGGLLIRETAKNDAPHTIEKMEQDLARGLKTIYKFNVETGDVLEKTEHMAGAWAGVKEQVRQAARGITDARQKSNAEPTKSLRLFQEAQAYQGAAGKMASIPLGGISPEQAAKVDATYNKLLELASTKNRQAREAAEAEWAKADASHERHLKKQAEEEREFFRQNTRQLDDWAKMQQTIQRNREKDATQTKRDLKEQESIQKAQLRNVTAEVEAAEKLRLANAKASAIAGIPANASASQRRASMAGANVAEQQGLVGLYGAQRATLSPGSAPHSRAVSNLATATKALATAQGTLNSANAAVAQSTSHVGKNMVQNIVHVTTWAAAVGVLYGSLGLLKRGAGSVVQLEYQIARLGQVFRHGQGQVQGLADDVLKLAAANGRTSQEAMESAIQWARLGLNRVQINEAVRVSLMAANVAEITAADATDHLSSLMKVYELSVRDLNGALGMLNATSNTYNVTNKDLLDGITRTSAAAKQSGISLAELIGLLGAGVGSTGQTGTNLGNALKSFIGSVSAPDKQKLMREQFKFETTGAEGDLKNMSQLLAELYVHFQKLNDAQRQSFIFNVAGKNQASRVTALLDNYIKAQTLAIQAQLGLNSAEKENEKIRETAKAQLQGLITEFERFALTTAKAGGSLEVFTEVITALRNSLAALSAGGGAGGVIVVSIMAAIAAKSLVMMTQMGAAGKSAGVLRNSMGGLKNALRDVSTALIEGIGLWGKMPGKIGASATAMSTVRRSTHGATAAFRALAVGIALATAELALIALALWGASKLFNVGMNAMGLSSDNANRGIDEFTNSAERARGAAEAAALQVRLFDTTLKALGASRSDAQRSQIISGVVEGMVPYESGESESARRAKDAQREAYRQQLENINRIGNALEKQAKFEKVFADASARASTERVKQKQAERFATESAMRLADEEVRRLKSKQLSDSKLNFFGRWASPGADNISQAEQRAAALREQKNKSYHEDVSDQENSRQQFAQRDLKHLTFLEAQKQLITDITALWNEMPANSYTSQLQAQIGAHQQILQTLEQRIAIERQVSEQAGAPRVAALNTQLTLQQRMADALQRQIDGGLSGSSVGAATNLGFDPFSEQGAARMRANVQHYRDRSSDGSLGNAPEEVQAMGELLPKLEKWLALKKEIAIASQEQATLTGSDAALMQSQARLNAMLEEEKGQRKEIAALKNSVGLTSLRDRIKLGAEFGAAESSSFRSGTTSGDALENQRAGSVAAGNEHKRLGDIAKANGNMAVMAEEYAQALQHGVEVQKTNKELLLHQLDLELKKKEAAKDYNKALAMGGPADLLRRMALSKLTNNFTKNMKGGEFLAFDQGSKQIIDDRMRPGWEAAENGNRLNRLGINGVNQVGNQNAGLENWLAALRKQLGEGMQPQISEAARAASALGGLADAAARAAAHLNRIGGANYADALPANAQNPDGTSL